MKSTALLLDLVHRVGDYLRTRENLLSCLAEQGVQVEGWLKGELLAFLRDDLLQNRLAHFDREVRPNEGQKKVDLTIRFSPKEIVWLELKHFLIGRQKGTSYDCQWYFKDRSCGILADLEKLMPINSAHKFLLILFTKNPGEEDWMLAIEESVRKFGYHLHPHTFPRDYPSYFFLGLLQLS